MRTHEELRVLYLANVQEGRRGYDGFTTEEIAAYNRRLMFGENGEAFPGQEEWARVVN
jgi:hypothetical protein